MIVCMNYKKVEGVGFVCSCEEKGSNSNLELPEGESQNLSQRLLGHGRRQNKRQQFKTAASTLGKNPLCWEFRVALEWVTQEVRQDFRTWFDKSQLTLSSAWLTLLQARGCTT